MGKYQIVYGRNVLKEALQQGIQIGEIYCRSKGDEHYVRGLRSSGQLMIRSGLPRGLQDEATQGVAFEMDHDFYVADLSKSDLQSYRFVLLCNHLEDVQNLGALARSAAAFGADLIVHENSRSFSMNAAALKVSMGQAFRLRFHRVSNLAPFMKKLSDMSFLSVGLEMEGGIPLYEWSNPSFPLALVVGSEGGGIAKPIHKQIEQFISVPMKDGVESLNAAQSAGIAMSWIFSKAQ